MQVWWIRFVPCRRKQKPSVVYSLPVSQHIFFFFFWSPWLDQTICRFISFFSLPSLGWKKNKTGNDTAAKTKIILVEFKIRISLSLFFICTEIVVLFAFLFSRHCWYLASFFLEGKFCFPINGTFLHTCQLLHNIFHLRKILW